MATKVQDFLKANPGYVGRANASNRAKAPEAPKSKKGSGNQSWLSSIISELGGAGGAAIGAAVGQAAIPIPVVGGLIGAGIGGFIGGTGGRAVENQMRDNEMRAGDALKEGALSGALSVIPGAGKLAFSGAKGALAKGAISVADDVAKGAAGLTDDVAKAAAKSVPKMGGIEKAGYNLKSSVRGYGIGAKAQGMPESLGMKGSKEIDSFLSKFKLGGGSPENLVPKVESVQAEIGKRLGDAYRSSGVTFTKSELAAMKKEIVSELGKNGNFQMTKANRAMLADKLSKLVKNDTAEKMFDFKKTLSSGINDAASPDAKLVDRELVNRLIRDKVTGRLGNRVPNVAQLNKDYSVSETALELLKKGAAQSKGGVTERIASLSPTKGALSRIGATVENTGKALAGTGTGKMAFPSQVTNQAFKQAPGNIVEALNTPAPEQPQGDLTGALESLGIAEDPTAGMTGDRTNMNTPQPVQELYPAANMMRDIQNDFATTGGKNVEKYLSLYKALAEVTGAASGTDNKLNVTKPTSEKYSNASSGMSSLQQYEQLLAQNPDVLTKSAVPGRGLPVVGGFLANALGTGESDALAYDMMDNLLRIRTGAQANPAEIKQYVTKMLPRAGDSQATVQRKLEIFRNTFGEILALAETGSSSSNPMYDAIANMGGSY